MTHQNLVIKMKTMMTVLAINQLSLSRYPQTSDQTLKAWNAADEYLIHHIGESVSIDETSNVLIINDQFGALTCSLANSLIPANVYSWIDSFLSKTATQINLTANNTKESGKQDFNHINQTTNKLPKEIQFDLIVIRIPKHNSLLEFQLKSLLPHINSNTKIIAAGMTKEIHNSNIKLFKKIIGQTTTSLAKKKARLIFSAPKSDSYTLTDCLLNKEAVSYQNSGLKVIGLPGVFSREYLDIGTRVLLNYMPQTTSNETLIDLGCGTGLLGALAANQNSQLHVIFTDESFLAVESAKQTYFENIDSSTNDSTSPQFITTNVLDGLGDNIADHILCNPPFHQQNVQTLSIANKMFKESAQKLKAHGELRVVANRHLKYKPMLSSYFKEVSIISNDPKFVVWLAKAPKI